MEKEKKGLPFIHVLRIIAAFAVVMIHSRALTDFEGSAGYTFMHNCILWCVPVFFMITGYIFLGIKKDVTYKKIWGNVVKFLVSLFTVGLFYAVLERVFAQKTIGISTFLGAASDVFCGNLWDHMWYVYAIIGIYLILPVLSAFVSASKNNLYILTALCGLFNVILYEISKRGICTVGFNFPFGGYCFYVLSGAVLHRIGEKGIKKLFIPSVVALAATVGVLAYVIFGLKIEPVTDYNFFYVAVMSVSVFVICSALGGKLKEGRILKKVADTTWGIYLIHPFFIHLFVKLFKVSIAGYSQILAFPLVSLAVFAISAVTVFVLKKIPGLKWLF